MNKISSTFLFLVIFISLWTPYILRIIFPKYEIYPSLVMPVGAGVIDNSLQEIEFEINELKGFKNGKIEELIELRDFFSGVQDHYFLPMFTSEFGTKKIDRSFMIKGIFPMRNNNRFTSENRLKTIEFLKLRLNALGFSTDSISVQRHRIKFDKSSKAITSKTLINESIIELY